MGVKACGVDGGTLNLVKIGCCKSQFWCMWYVAYPKISLFLILFGLLLIAYAYPDALIIHHTFITNCIHQITSFGSKFPCYLSRICKLMVIMVHLDISNYGCNKLVFDLVSLVKSSWNPNSWYLASIDHLFCVGALAWFWITTYIRSTLVDLIQLILLVCALVH